MKRRSQNDCRVEAEFGGTQGNLCRELWDTLEGRVGSPGYSCFVAVGRGRRRSAAVWGAGFREDPPPTPPSTWLTTLLVPLCFKSGAHEFEPRRASDSDLALDSSKSLWEGCLHTPKDSAWTQRGIFEPVSPAPGTADALL